MERRKSRVATEQKHPAKCVWRADGKQKAKIHEKENRNYQAISKRTQSTPNTLSAFYEFRFCFSLHLLQSLFKGGILNEGFFSCLSHTLYAFKHTQTHTCSFLKRKKSCETENKRHKAHTFCMHPQWCPHILGPKHIKDSNFWYNTDILHSYSVLCAPHTHTQSATFIEFFLSVGSVLYAGL